ncbi:MAG: hypothetical protein OEY14_12590 [Myxococcales bacterium]|nr:hypothetical protein [Myxococcales bacterium]
MYRCQICNAVSAPGTRANRVVLETRPAEYPSRPKAQSTRIGRKLKHFDDSGGAGYEIASEAIVCRTCASTHVPKEIAAVDDEA